MLKVQVNGPVPRRQERRGGGGGGGGGRPEYPEKTPDNQSENRYHILEVKFHHPTFTLPEGGTADTENTSTPPPPSTRGGKGYQRCHRSK